MRSFGVSSSKASGSRRPGLFGVSPPKFYPSLFRISGVRVRCHRPHLCAARTPARFCCGFVIGLSLIAAFTVLPGIASTYGPAAESWSLYISVELNRHGGRWRLDPASFFAAPLSHRPSGQIDRERTDLGGGKDLGTTEGKKKSFYTAGARVYARTQRDMGQEVGAAQFCGAFTIDNAFMGRMESYSWPSSRNRKQNWTKKNIRR